MNHAPPFILALALLAGAAHAQTAPPAQGATAPAITGVATRATLRSSFSEDAGRRHYVRLRLELTHAMPFSTITYRLPDPGWLAGLPIGSRVVFTAARIDGENTLTAIAKAP